MTGGQLPGLGEGTSRALTWAHPTWTSLVSEPSPFPNVEAEPGEILWLPLPTLATTGGEGTSDHSDWSGAVSGQK